MNKWNQLFIVLSIFSILLCKFWCSICYIVKMTWPSSHVERRWSVQMCVAASEYTPRLNKPQPFSKGSSSRINVGQLNDLIFFKKKPALIGMQNVDWSDFMMKNDLVPFYIRQQSWRHTWLCVLSQKNTRSVY